MPRTKSSVNPAERRRSPRRAVPGTARRRHASSRRPGRRRRAAHRGNARPRRPCRAGSPVRPPAVPPRRGPDEFPLRRPRGAHRGRTPRRGSRVGRTHGGLGRPHHRGVVAGAGTHHRVCVAAASGRRSGPGTAAHSHSPTAPSSLLPPSPRARVRMHCAPTGCAEPSPRCLPTPPHDGGTAGAAVSIPRSWCRPSCRTRRGDGAALERMRLGQETT